MRKYKVLISLVLFCIISVPVLVLAKEGGVSTPIFQNPLKVDSITALLSLVLDIVVQVGLVFIVLFIIYAGFLFVTAGGKEAQVTKARETLVATLIGSAIILGAYAIASALKSTVDQLKTGVVSQVEEKINFKV
ncbi:MAG: hypothetical protein NT041_00940 [Candidatus Vogelbacteria bacterium]|nr:hypothetical protein [Candidatus Vogelbacteria bacterium]